jgi:hypothetical protein
LGGRGGGEGDTRGCQRRLRGHTVNVAEMMQYLPCTNKVLDNLIKYVYIHMYIIISWFRSYIMRLLFFRTVSSFILFRLY